MKPRARIREIDGSDVSIAIGVVFFACWFASDLVAAGIAALVDLFTIHETAVMVGGVAALVSGVWYVLGTAFVALGAALSFVRRTDDKNPRVVGSQSGSGRVQRTPNYVSAVIAALLFAGPSVYFAVHFVLAVFIGLSLGPVH